MGKYTYTPVYFMSCVYVSSWRQKVVKRFNLPPCTYMPWLSQNNTEVASHMTGRPDPYGPPVLGNL